jgi:sigma-54 dependent transcriptional regulator, acetoin dehydrogenase operon transcriptional activator AcoR
MESDVLPPAVLQNPPTSADLSAPSQKDWLRDIDFRQLVEDLQIMVCVYDIYGFIYINPIAEKVTGYTLGEVRKKMFWELTHPEDEVWLKPRGMARLRGEEVASTREFRILKKNGQVMWINVFWMITQWRGRNAVIMGFVDVTENKQLTEALKASRDQLEDRVKQRTVELDCLNTELMFLNQNLNNIVRNISDGVVTVNQAGDITLLNAFFDRISSGLPAALTNRLREMILHDDISFLNKMLRENKSFQDEELIFPSAEGSVGLLVSGTPILNEEGVVQGGVLIFRPMKDVHRLIQRFSGYRASFCFEDIVTRDPIMLTLIENAKHTASSMSHVVIEGESGTGKELFAQAIHNHGPRSNGPFIAINCGAIPRELIGSELFGYAEGAFTGAKKRGNPGKFELASGGTLFLDEIGDMSFDQQCSLLRVIQEKKVTRIGGHQEIPIDVRIICATNKDLYAEMKTGSFRNDLYYRLNVINIKIPPLRDRRGDIMLLFDHFLKMAERHAQKNHIQISSDVQKNLIRYDWPGNVRELQNLAERLVNITPGTCMEAGHLPPEITAASPAVEGASPADSPLGPNDPIIDVKAARNLYRRRFHEAQQKRIMDLLDHHAGNVSRVAKELGISRTTLYKKIRPAPGHR